MDRTFYRWEQLGGGSARGPLFQFHMQPIGRRRRWREVVERAQFNAQFRQLRDPVAGDNIGMALTEALHHAMGTELDREQRPAHHFVNFAITAHGFTHAYQTANFTVGGGGGSCNGRLDWMRCWPRQVKALVSRVSLVPRSLERVLNRCS